ncbi:MAG: hypothetical protein Q4A74_06085, partial [Cardiobacteriaceae bacterium]|nr:hypothetical protein [Cardiobacteriaceae bacterium]
GIHAKRKSVNNAINSYNLYTKYFLDALDCREGTSDVVDPCPNGIMRANFAHETWGFPKNYILFSTGEGEGGYFYNTEDGTVWDAGVGEVPLLGTDQLRHWNSFYEFMIWYLTPEEEEE